MSTKTTIVNNDKFCSTTVREFDTETNQSILVEKDCFGGRQIIEYTDHNTNISYENEKILGVFDSRGKEK